MKTITMMVLCGALAACDPMPDGYYDAAGNFHATSLNRSASHPPLPGGRDIVTGTDGSGHYVYDRAGYYDYSGYYVGRGPDVPRRYLPPRGMCRIWFIDRDYRYQPPVEDCDDIQYRVPAGAYVIYGG